MLTESAREPLSILRDGSQFQWYVIPLFRQRGLHRLIFLFGYLHFFLISFWVHDMKTMRSKVLTAGIIYGEDVTAMAIFGVVLGWI